jgi:predicted RNA binding protein YcfA (HicA-like mRNA interferase family)
VTRIPEVSWKDVVKAFENSGFLYDRQKGSHLVYFHPETNATVVVPRHRSIKKGTLSHILKQAGLTRDEFLELIK